MSIKYPLIIAPNFLPPAPAGTEAFWGEFQVHDARYEVDQWGQLWEIGTYGLPSRSMWPYTGDLFGYTNDGHGPTLREWGYRFSFVGGQLAAVNSALDYTLRKAPEPMPAYGLVGPGASRPFVVTHEGDAVVASVQVLHAAGRAIVMQVQMETTLYEIDRKRDPLFILTSIDGDVSTWVEIPCLAGFESHCFMAPDRNSFRIYGLLRE